MARSYSTAPLRTGSIYPSLRRNMGVVLQQSRLSPGNIFQNIVGNSGLTVDDAWEAARLAGVADDIEAMPMGMQRR